MIFKLSAAAILVTFSPADEPAMSAGMDVSSCEDVVIELDEDGSVIDVFSIELDDRVISQVCSQVSEYFELAGLSRRFELMHSRSQYGRTAYHTIPYARMVEVLDQSAGREA